MSELFHKTFASDLSEFSSVTTSNGTIEQSSGAGLNGTTGGVLCTRTGNSPQAYGHITSMALSGLSAFRMAFFIDCASLAMNGNGNSAILWYPRDSSGNARLGSMRMIQVSGVQYLRCQVLPDTDVTVDVDVSLALQPDWVEVEIVREVTNGSNDGEMRFYFGGGDYPDAGQLVAEFLSVQNYDDFNAVDRVRIGIQFGSSAVTGTLKIDEIIARNDNEPILYVEAPATADFSPYKTVIDGNPAGWDAYFENVSCVVKFNDTYFLYYIGGDTDADEGDDWVYNRQVGVATSPDMVNWTKYGSNPILSFTPEGDQPEEGIGDCKCVVYDGKVHMYYSALRWRSGGDVDVEIRYRVSTDGFTFTDDTLIVDDTDEELYASGVYVTPGGTFHLWYAGPLTGGVGDLKKLSGSDPASLSSDGTITTNDYSSRGGIVPLDADNLLFFNDRFFDGSITCTLIKTAALGTLSTVFPAIDFNGGGAALDVPGCFFYEDGQWFQFSIKSSSAAAPFDTTQIVMRTSPELPAFQMAASSNIAASAATATTAIMSAPGGKTTGDFDAGTISDDTNPLPSVNLTDDAYTELEWCLQATAYAGPDVVYEFRVSDDGAALDTYTDLPEWTIEAEAEAYALTVDPSSVAITPTAVTLLVHRVSSVDPAAVAVTPVGVDLLRHAQLGIDPAAVAATPVNPSLLAHRHLILDPASVAVTPVDVTLEASAAPSAYSLSLDPASVSVTPVDVSALSHRVVSLDPASALISPVDPSLLKHVAVRVDPASVSITPTDPSLLAHYALAQDPETVEVTPTAVNLQYSEAPASYDVSVTPASVAVTPSDAALTKHAAISIDAGAVALTTVALGLARGYQLSIAPSVVSVSTVGVMVRGAFLIPCDPAAVTMTPRDMSLAWSGAPVYGNVLRLADARLWVPGVTGEALGIPQQAQEALRLPGITNEALIES